MITTVNRFTENQAHSYNKNGIAFDRIQVKPLSTIETKKGAYYLRELKGKTETELTASQELDKYELETSSYIFRNVKGALTLLSEDLENNFVCKEIEANVQAVNFGFTTLWATLTDVELDKARLTSLVIGVSFSYIVENYKDLSQVIDDKLELIEGTYFKAINGELSF